MYVVQYERINSNMGIACEYIIQEIILVLTIHRYGHAEDECVNQSGQQRWAEQDWDWVGTVPLKGREGLWDILQKDAARWGAQASTCKCQFFILTLIFIIYP